MHQFMHEHCDIFDTRNLIAVAGHAVEVEHPTQLLQIRVGRIRKHSLGYIDRFFSGIRLAIAHNVAEIAFAHLLRNRLEAWK